MDPADTGPAHCVSSADGLKGRQQESQPTGLCCSSFLYGVTEGGMKGYSS